MLISLDTNSIRPLLTTDLKKRRLSGRDQILPGGEHIIDGVPFGRPRLRAPRGRPPVAIAPRKRRRLLDDQTYNPGYDDNDAGEFLADGRHSGSDRELGDVDRVQRLLLTRHGEDASRPMRQVRFASGPSTGSVEESDEEFSSVEERSEQDEDEDIAEADAQELADEAADLRRGLTEEEDENRRSKAKSRSRSQSMASDYPKRPSGSNTNAFESGGGGQDAYETPPTQNLPLDLTLIDKVVAVRAAFNVSHDDAVKLLLKHNKDVSKVWRALERSLKPRQGLAETMVLATQLELPREVQLMSSPARSPVGTLRDVSRIDDDEQAESSSSDEDDSMDDPDDDTEHGSGAMESNSEGDSDSSSEYLSARPSPPQDDTVDDSVSSIDDSSSDSEKEQGSTKSHELQPKKIKTRSRTATLPEAQQDDSSDSSDASDSSSEEDAPNALRIKGRRPQKIVSSPSADSSSSSDVSSDSSSESSSDSSSDSGSNSESEEAKIVPAIQSTSFASTELKKKSDSGPQENVPAPNALVPPGQGFTRTQRRNQRRRLQLRAKKAALQSLDNSQSIQDMPAGEADLEAKKRTLLQTLTTGLNTFNEEPRQMVDNVQMADEDQNAWKNKILYRAVECVQEGVELSEPPFPFVQRWDPQQRWDSQPSQRRGKRKARADSQFYNSTGSHSTKKRKSEQPAGEYYYHEDTTALLAYQEDIELDYDDATFNPDEDPITNGFTDQPSRHTDEQAVDDLPPLPEDMSSLPVLNAIDVKLGLMIAWKQLICTEATQWQPQLSNYVTASVTEAREGSAFFQVQLARRDRNLDRNMKKYDEETGQRVYGKFEAPDSDEDEDDDQAPEEDDDGIREISFAEMIEPRIVQQAAETNGVDHSGEDPAKKDSSSNAAPYLTAPHLPELGFEVADSQPKQRSNNKESSDKRAESEDPSARLENDQGTQQESGTIHSMNIDASATLEESLVPETVHDEADFPAEEVSITENRRGEICELINRGGFRQEVRSSIDQSAFLQFGQGSPSRQLEEEYASSVLLSHQMDTSRSSSGAPSEYDARDPTQNEISRLDYDSVDPSEIPSRNGVKRRSQQKVSQAAVAADADVDTSHSAPQTPSLQQMRLDRLGDKDSTRLTTPGGQNSTGTVEYPKLNISQTTQNSSLSGRRQLDPNFISHSDDLGVSFNDDDTALGGDSIGNDQPEPGRTPTQHMYNDGLQNASGSDMPFKSTRPDAQPLSRPQSAASDGSDNSFPDIKFLSSQVAKNKFQEFSRIKTERRTSQDDHANDELPLQPSRLSQHAEVSSPPPTHESLPTAHFMDDGRHDTNGGSARSNSVSFQESISPPALSRPRQTRSSSSSQNISRDKAIALARSTGLSNSSNNGPGSNGVKEKTKADSFVVPNGSQVMSLLTSSPEPEPEPEFTEMYADDSVDEDYLGSFSKTKKAAATRRISQPGPRKRRASVPVAEREEERAGPGWVGGSQGPSRKASGRFGGRVSSAGGF